MTADEESFEHEDRHTREADFAAYVGAFFVPTLIGNVLGGVTLVAVLNYGQVAEELEE